MLGIHWHRNYRWRSSYQWIRTAFNSLPHFFLEVVSFGRLTLYRSKIHRSFYLWKVSLAGLSTCIVILLSLGYLDCDWLYRYQKKEK